VSLATRCPSCDTVFRVVQDQLKVSDGWVRCGRCSEVFNAAQRLFELEADGTAQRSQSTGATTGHAPPSAARAAEPAAAPAPGRTSEVTPAPDHVLASSAVPATQAASAPLQASAPTPMPGQPSGMAESTPDFLRHAERAARRRHPARRGRWALVVLLLVALLPVQIGLHYRDHLAAHWPIARPALQAACGLLGCRVEAPHRIDSLHVDGSGLVRVQGTTQYRLSLIVRNQARTPVRMPAVDLALTDAQGLTLARRVFGAAELGQPASSLGPGGETLLQATLDLGEQRVAGYTIELFYP
jgi:predicted Zn finger-like uncharacterized protein